MVWNNDFMKTKHQRSYFNIFFTAWERWCRSPWPPPEDGEEPMQTSPAAPLRGGAELLFVIVTIMQTERVIARCSVRGCIKAWCWVVLGGAAPSGWSLRVFSQKSRLVIRHAASVSSLNLERFMTTFISSPARFIHHQSRFVTVVVVIYCKCTSKLLIIVSGLEKQHWCWKKQGQ